MITIIDWLTGLFGPPLSRAYFDDAMAKHEKAVQKAIRDGVWEGLEQGNAQMVATLQEGNAQVAAALSEMTQQVSELSGAIRDLLEVGQEGRWSCSPGRR